MATGRPRKDIDKTNFEKLCGLFCTLDEIAGFFDCSEDTIERWCKREYKQSFAEISAKKRGLGQMIKDHRTKKKRKKENFRKRQL